MADASTRASGPRPVSVVVAALVLGLAFGLAALPTARAQEAMVTFSQEGVAAAMPPVLAGRTTASGERYRPTALSAAHRTLPLGSVVRVTALASGRSTVVRVNDRGPFVPGRLMDLSEAAARAIGLGRGFGRVRIEVLQGRLDEETRALLEFDRTREPTRPAAPSSDLKFTVQLASYSVVEAARARADLVEGAWIQRVRVDEGVRFRVNYGLFDDRPAAEAERRRLEDRGQSGFVKSMRPGDVDRVGPG